jgi:hypothetical protein
VLRDLFLDLLKEGGLHSSTFLTDRVIERIDQAGNAVFHLLRVIIPAKMPIDMTQFLDMILEITELHSLRMTKIKEEYCLRQRSHLDLLIIINEHNPELLGDS